MKSKCCLVIFVQQKKIIYFILQKCYNYVEPNYEPNT